MARLTESQRKRARELVARAALLGYSNRERIHYTQGSQRWDGIDNYREAREGEYPRYADCSAYATWALWNGLYIPYDKPDVVNNLSWDYGNTGSQIRNGRPVARVSHMRKGDLVFYAYSGSTPTHVAIVVGRKPDNARGKPHVVSFGQESGPLYLPYDYRRLVQVRRYVHDGV